MYLILGTKVILGIDGFIRDPLMGTQIRTFCFGLNIWYANDDQDPDGNGLSVEFGLPHINKVI